MRILYGTKIRAAGRWLLHLLDRLTRPAAVVQKDPELSFRARLTSGVLLFWSMAFLFEGLWWLWSGHGRTFLHLEVVLPAVFFLYLLSRTRFVSWAALGGVLGLTLLIHLLAYLAWQQAEIGVALLVTPPQYLLVSHLIWLLFPILAAAVLLPGVMDVLAIVLIVHSVWALPRLLSVQAKDVSLLYGILLGISGPIAVVASLQKHQRQRLVRLRTQMAEQRNFLHSIIDAIDSPFYVIDAATYEIVLANQRARALGIDRAKTCYALTHRRTTPCDGADHPCPLVHVRTHREPFVVEHLHYTPEGRPYYAEVHGYPILDEQGDVRFMVEYSLDITRRKEVEESLRKLWRAIEHSAHGVLITDAQGVIEYVNPAFTAMTGYTAEEAIGKTPAILRSGYHDDEFYTDLWRTIRSGQVWQGEFVNRRKDGSLYYEEQTIAPVRDEKGTITHFIAVKRDITEYKRLIRELKEAKVQTEQALAFKSALLAAISHDLRTPLGAIMGYADMLREGLFGEINAEQRARLAAILSSAQYMQELLSMLLLHAEVESNSLRIERKAVPLRKMLMTVYESLRVLADKRDLTLELDFRPGAPDEVYTDPRLLRGIVTNLVSNALKFTRQGGVTIRVERLDEQRWALAVADTGVGMSEEERRRIFEPFFTRSQVKMSGAPGLGLGLYIVRSLVERLDGSIEVWSEEGKGSVFTVIFPYVPPPRPQTPTSQRLRAAN